MNEPSTELIRAALLHYAEEEFGWTSFSAFTNYYNAKDKQYTVPGLGAVVIVDYHDADSDKNYDGWSEDIWIVFKIFGKLYKATGTHTSYDGGGWDKELKIVVPKEKTILVYEEE